jgi:hypothetical protein
MTEKDDDQEQRRHKRYNIKSGAFALLKSNDLEILGSIKDISSHGICLAHIDENQELKDDKITVNLITEDACYEDFPSKNIWDREEEGGFIAAMVKMKRRGVRFEELSKEKQLQLDDFIETMTKK